MMKQSIVLISVLMLVSACGSDEPRLAPTLVIEQQQADQTQDQLVTDETPMGEVASPEDETKTESGTPSNQAGTDPLAELESSVLVPNVNLNFARGAEDACVAALSLTGSGKLSTQGFTYNDKSCRRLIDSIPIPQLPENDIDTAYLRGFQEMLAIMFRPGQLCAPNGECFVKEDVLPVVP